jgi:AraC family transcriptional regulator
MHAWEAIQNSLNYIEDHLSENIKIETLANVASLSPYYFQRLFGRLVKKSVNEYVRLRRLAKASEALKSKEKRIIDVALDYGFSDHANFTRAFKDAYGITPDEYRAYPVILNHFIRPDLFLNYVTVDENVPIIADGIVVEVIRRKLDEPRTFIGIEGEVPVAELTGGKATGIATTGLIWEEFHRQKSNIPHLLPNGNEFGILYLGDAREGCCNYMAGAETAGNIQEDGYVSYTLPSGEYAVCCFEAENFAELIGSAIFKATSFMNCWMKKHSLTCGDFAAEIYYDNNPDASYMELWLPLSSSQRILKSKETWNKNNGTQKPSMAAISAYVNSTLFECLCKHVETEYQCKPVMEYSRCSLQYGWNVKYKKAGRTLCTLYPMEGYFIALIVIGYREQTETELSLPFFTEYLQQLYHETKMGMGQKWLMVNVMDDAVLEDVKQCIAIRRGKKKN